MYVVKKISAEGCVRTYGRELKDLRYKIEKNFVDMDFENADARQEMAGIVSEILNVIDRELDKLSSYRFYEL